MAWQLGPKELLGTPATNRSPRTLNRPWIRGPAYYGRRHTTNGVAPHAAFLASGVPVILGWSHTVTSGSHHGASLWFTTLCALSVALGALSYNLMAVLAEFFNFDRRGQQLQRARTYLHGVDVTHSRFFQLPSVLAAVDFAAEAHRHQRRKTGEPYVTHCIETALIVEACLPRSHSATEQDRHVACIMAAVLHDVIDDTPTDLSSMTAAFGPRVADLVVQVSKLSQMNQLLRRGKRQGWAQYSPDHFKQLRKLIVDLAFEEPLVILVKLADRLHNMRTVYVLAPEKQRSVAEETLEVWCSMAESLGWDGLKSEMEDLCFAVLQPSTYCTLRAELDRLWNLPTLAVVEQQLEDEQQAAAGPAASGDLGLRIVQVPQGPEAPVRHYARAAGVRAAAAEAAGGGSGGGAARRRRPMRQEEAPAASMATVPPPPPVPAHERAQALAAQAAVAATAVPLPRSLSAAASDMAALSSPAVAVAAGLPSGVTSSRLVVAATVTATAEATEAATAPEAAVAVAVLELERRPAEGAAGSSALYGSEFEGAVAVVAPATAGASATAAAWSATAAVGSAATSAAAADTAAAATAAVALSAEGSSRGALASWGFESTSMSMSAPAVAGGGSLEMELPGGRLGSSGSSSSAPASWSSGTGSSSLDSSTANLGSGSSSSNRSGTSSSSSSSSSDSLASYGSGYGSEDGSMPYSLATFGTMESVDGPLLLDDIRLPLGLRTAAAAASSTSSMPSTSGAGSPAASASASASNSGGTDSSDGYGSSPPSSSPSSGNGWGQSPPAQPPLPRPQALNLSQLPARFGRSGSPQGPLPPLPPQQPPAAPPPSPAPVPRVIAGAPTLPLPLPPLPPLPPPLAPLLKSLAGPGPGPAAGLDPDRTATDGALDPTATGAPAAAAAAASPTSSSPSPPAAPLSPLSQQQERLKLILSTVVPFESVSFKSLGGWASSTRRGLEVLDECAALLYNEIQIRSQAGGLGINIQGRLKSLHSVYRKMVRKKVAVAQVYDSRALRVIVDDGEGSSLQEAVDVCYRLVSAVHSIWKPIKREFDDYIANPKPSGYQALHTAVRGPGGIPMEVQIKTSSMHDLAEYGAAAHWVYKEYTPLLQSPGRSRRGAERLPEGYVGQPILKVAKDKLRYGVVVSRESDGQRLVAAVKLGATFRPFPTRVPDYAFYSGLLAYTRSKSWQVPGHGDLVLRLEEFVKCDDGRYHRRDHMGYLIPAETITLLEGFEEDAAAAAREEQRRQQQQLEEGTAAAEGQSAAAVAGSGPGPSAARSSVDEELLGGGESGTAAGGSAAAAAAEQRRFREQMRVTFAKTQQLRSMIEWGRGAIGKYAASADLQSDEVSVLIWPGGHIEHWARGTTAGDIVARKGIITTGEGYDGYRVNLLINVNNRLVPEDTVLNDGDLVILAREKVRI